MIGKLISKVCPIFMVPENSPVNEKKYLANRKNDISIYKNEGNKNIYPLIKFKNSKAIIEKLCLIDFEGDDIYKCIEVQEIKQKNKLYYVVFLNQETQVDIYYTKGLMLSEDDYKSLMNKVTLNERDSIKTAFNVTENGVDVHLSLKDRQNRNIEFKIKENKKKLDDFGLIAPIGNMSKVPDKFPVIYLKNFNMVEQKGTEIFVTIDGKKLRPIKLFPFCNFKRAYLARYSYRNNINELNNDYSGILEPVRILKDGDEINVDNDTYSIYQNNGHPEIKYVKTMYGKSEMKIKFSPAVPDIISLKDSTEVHGRFSISVDEVNGIMGGVYSIDKKGNSVNMKINPQKGWQPMPGKLWMKTYLWNCDITILGDKLKVKSKWSRNEIINTYDKLKGK